MTTIRSPKRLIGISKEPARADTIVSTVKDIIDHWRSFARQAIEQDGKEPAHYARLARSEVLDRVTAAARLLVLIKRAEIYLGRGDVHSALHQAMLGWTYVHQLTVVDVETSIKAWLLSKEGSHLGGVARALINKDRNITMAQEYEERKKSARRGTGSAAKSESALMYEIGQTHGLKPGASRNAINAGLKILHSQRGKLRD